MAALEVIATEVAVGFQVPDDGLDGGPASDFLLDRSTGPARPAGTVDAQGFGRVVADIALVDIGPFDLDPGQSLVFRL